MLVSLSVRNIVLIDRLDLDLQAGLSVLTGETGAGKSILLDALGLALGDRAEARLLRHGADQASVTAAFELPPGHPATAELRDQGLEDEGLLVLRRVLAGEGRSRAFVNDQPVSVSLLRRLGEHLVEIQGQFEQRGLLDPASHRGLLDAYGGLQPQANEVAGLWRSRRQAATALDEARSALEQARRDEDFLRHAVDELAALDAQAGEEAELAGRRKLLMHGEKLAEALNEAAAALDGETGGAGQAVRDAQRHLDRVAEAAAGRLQPALDALDRAAAEIADAEGELGRLSADLDLDPRHLQEVEERYFALKDMARKHTCDVDELPALHARLARRLKDLDRGSDDIADLERSLADADRRYVEAAGKLAAGRTAAATSLDAAVARELPPLKLDKAVFSTRLEALDAADWGPQGSERVAFEVATNPGAPPGPLGRIASGGELARFLLALKVVLAQASPNRTLVFDEVDSGVGGATAAAVGERLGNLAEGRQILVITHSPQVAARGANHWLVSKQTETESALTRVRRLDPAARREEVARMLAGAEITDEARAAAARLMGGR